MFEQYTAQYRELATLLQGGSVRKTDDLIGDFIELTALKLSIQCDPVHREARTRRYKDLQEEHAKHWDRIYSAQLTLIELIKDHFKNGEIADVLGNVYSLNGLPSPGQEFTPSDAAVLVAELGLTNVEKLPPCGFFDFCDDSSGGGSLLLSAAQILMQKGFHVNRHMVAFGNDVDIRSVHMAYAQLSLYGIPAVIIHGNTITLEETAKWYTPMYVFGQWVMRKTFSLKSGVCRTDELLKITTIPHYGHVLEAYQLMCGINNDVECDEDAATGREGQETP